jgi:ATP-dependent DNA ligase
MPFPIAAPVEPMLASPGEAIPDGDGWQYEPKWDGFRVLVFRDGDELLLQSRELKPLDRYFPELAGPLRAELPPRCVADGELVVAGGRGLDFDALVQRIHPAASRVHLLAAARPASLVLFDLLALGERDLRAAPLAERRALLAEALGRARPPVHLTPATTDAAAADDWFRRFEGAGLDGVVAKRLEEPYRPGARGWVKVKHARTADCAVAGFRWHKGGEGSLVGSVLLGLHDDAGTLQHVGSCSSFTAARRRELALELEPLRAGAAEGHPWRGRAGPPGDGGAAAQRVPGAQTRWSRGKDLSWEPLRVERVCEVAYDHLQGDRFRHTTRFLRWRPDRSPADCRYDQLEATPPFELARIFGPGGAVR